VDSQIRKILLLVQTANAWSRQVLKGVADYAHAHGPWEFFIEPRGLYEQLRIPPGWNGDGIIARVDYSELAQMIEQTGRPAVNVATAGSHSPRIPKVVSDQVACGRLAAEHLLQAGFRHFGYVAPPPQPYLDDAMGRQFIQTLREANCECHVLEPTGPSGLSERAGRAQVMRWLRESGKPMGVLVWSDALGREVITACAAAHIGVPDEVALLSAEYDPLMSALSPLPLSSLDMVPAKIGYEAASLLDRMMSGQPGPRQPVLIPPVGIVQRQSSDTFAMEDADLSMALRYIREHAHRPISVTDVLDAVSLSRRALEQRFAKFLGRSPAKEIRRVRLQRAKRLLVETDLPVPVIASQSGFNHPEVMIRAFRREMGISPGQYRRFR